jgi:hypothetical protein
VNVHLHQQLAPEGVLEFLVALSANVARASIGEDEALDLLAELSVQDAPGTLADLLSTNVLARVGNGVTISRFGTRTVLLLEALNGADLRSVVTRLTQYDADLNMYQLVREGMTRQFFESLLTRPGFQRLYLCSPWISLDARSAEILTHAWHRATRRGVEPELLVITRPVPGQRRMAPPTLAPLQELGAVVYLNAQLHTKLYIREPDLGGGYSMAIFGSQNLTKSQYRELGIRINADAAIINQLIAYFFEVSNVSIELEEAP